MLSAIRNTLRVPVTTATRLFQTSVVQASDKFDHKRIPLEDEGVQGEKIVDLDSALKVKQNLFPTLDSDNLLFNGMLYKDLPICNIRVSHNNTIFTLTDAAGTVKVIRSCGMEGFKNTKKGTNIAAQTTAISIATRAIDRGFKTIRVRVQGLGPGRLAAVKGLQMGGLEIISITDNTHVSWNPPRARKARRL
ncbi:28S ribosomal protein S11, mitochondrial [Trichoplusia ni]|uniref:28S ribosomal protein S11, mitochondrial n=1 Tax=Trichoplusia ni TaxID=7111 RepID=A0A7E5VTU0_TRINI|nr:28S ribosomal protein S11, mitochondrial [Trichoplusia ni]